MNEALITTLATLIVAACIIIFRLIRYDLAREKDFTNLFNDYYDLKNRNVLLESQNDIYKSLYGSYKPKRSKLEEAYYVLGCDSFASIQEVKNKYRILLKKYHPDINNSDSAKQTFVRVKQAYDLIKQKSS